MAGASGRHGPVFDPARGVQTATVPLASASEVGAVVEVASEAAAAWSAGALSARAGVLFRLRDLLTAAAADLAVAVTAEHGKVLRDAAGEVARGIENIEFACGIPHLLKGSHSTEVSSGVDVHTVLEPLGVVAGITPFNFPVMVPLWMLANAWPAGTPSSSSRRRRIPARRSSWRSWPRRPGCPTASSTSCTVTPSPSTPSWPTPTSRPCRSWAARPSPGTSTRAGPGTASGCRRWAGPRTTWWSCPTPTSTRPRTRRCPPVSDRPASVAWRCRWSWPSERSRTPLVAAIAARVPSVVIGPGDDPESQMGPLVTARAPRQGAFVRRRGRVRGCPAGRGREG